MHVFCLLIFFLGEYEVFTEERNVTKKKQS